MKKHAAITERQRTIIQLRDEEKLPWTEISAEIGLSAGNCNTLYTRAKRELARRVEIREQIEAYASEDHRSVYAKVRRRLERELERAELLDEGSQPRPQGPQPSRRANPERQKGLVELLARQEAESMPPVPSEPMSPVELPRVAANAGNAVPSAPPSEPRKVYQFPSGRVFESAQRGGQEIRIHAHEVDYYDDQNRPVEVIQCVPAPRLGMILTEDGDWIDPPKSRSTPPPTPYVPSPVSFPPPPQVEQRPINLCRSNNPKDGHSPCYGHCSRPVRG